MRFRIAATTLMGIALAWHPISALAQISPNCLRNGKNTYCAVTAVRSQDPQQISEVITFADHRIVAVMRDQRSCRQVNPTTTRCRASIQPRGAAKTNQNDFNGIYIGTSYEGGYKHEYRNRMISVTYFVLD